MYLGFALIGAFVGYCVGHGFGYDRGLVHARRVWNQQKKGGK